MNFSFTKALEENWQAILKEYRQLPKEKIKPWYEKELYQHDWSVFGLYGFGRKIRGNCQWCPVTTRSLNKFLDFAWLAFPVWGPRLILFRCFDAVLRCHLGLIIPQDCGFRAGGVTRQWEKGKCLIFDDTVIHESWNHSNETKVVLLIDFLKGGRSFSLRNKIRLLAFRFLAANSLKT